MPAGAMTPQILQRYLQRAGGTALVGVVEPPIDMRQRLPEDGIGLMPVERDAAIFVRRLLPIEIDDRRGMIVAEV